MQEADRKTMKTKHRILVTSLSLFNELGEPNVTTVDISNEMEISPGNLYYHYRNKDDIIEHIVSQYDQDIGKILQAEQELDGLIEHWLFLKVIVEKNWQYRFIFRDLENLASKYKNVERKLSRIQNKLTKCMMDFARALVFEKETLQGFSHQEALGENMCSILTRTPLKHTVICQAEAPDEMLSHTCFQTMLTLWPWLSTEDQAILEELRLSY